jgi:hypothetical protein
MIMAFVVVTGVVMIMMFPILKRCTLARFLCVSLFLNKLLRA